MIRARVIRVFVVVSCCLVLSTCGASQTLPFLKSGRLGIEQVSRLGMPASFERLVFISDKNKRHVVRDFKFFDARVKLDTPRDALEFLRFGSCPRIAGLLDFGMGLEIFWRGAMPANWMPEPRRKGYVYPDGSFGVYGDTNLRAIFVPAKVEVISRWGYKVERCVLRYDGGSWAPFRVVEHVSRSGRYQVVSSQKLSVPVVPDFFRVPVIK